MQQMRCVGSPSALPEFSFVRGCIVQCIHFSVVSQSHNRCESFSPNTSRKLENKRVRCATVPCPVLLDASTEVIVHSLGKHCSGIAAHIIGKPVVKPISKTSYVPEGQHAYINATDSAQLKLTLCILSCTLKRQTCMCPALKLGPGPNALACPE